MGGGDTHSQVAIQEILLVVVLDFESDYQKILLSERKDFFSYLNIIMKSNHLHLVD